MQSPTNQEFETKVINIDPVEIEAKLLKLGALKVGEYNYRRYVYGIHDNEKGWLRLRTDGHTTTITFKSKDGQGIGETTEIETEVKDFDTMHQIVIQTHVKNCMYQENKRIKYEKDQIEFCIDFWPLVPPWLEIESNSEQKVKEGLKLLGLEGEDIGNMSAKQTFKQYYNLDLLSYENLTFQTTK